MVDCSAWINFISTLQRWKGKWW